MPTAGGVMKSWRSSVAMALVSFAVAAAAAELLLAWYAPDIPIWSTVHKRVGMQYPSAYSSYLPFTLPRGSTMLHLWGPEPKRVAYVFNEYGFRGPAVAPPPAGPRNRLVVLGDSFAFGWLMAEDQTFPARLAARLAAEGRACAVINGGYHAAYSPDAYYAALQRERAYFAPSIVVVALYMGNDVTDVGENQWTALDAFGLPLRVSTQRAFVGPEGWYIQSDAPLYRLPLLRESRLVVGLAGLLARSDRKGDTDAWTAFTAVLAGLHRLAGELGADDLFVLIPPIKSADGITNTYALEDPASDATRDHLRRVVGAPVLDLREMFATEPDLEALSMPRDGHFTEIANVKVAEAVHQALAASGALARRCPTTGRAGQDSGRGDRNP
jgi:hypothetical protein